MGTRPSTYEQPPQKASDVKKRKITKGKAANGEQDLPVTPSQTTDKTSIERPPRDEQKHKKGRHQSESKLESSPKRLRQSSKDSSASGFSIYLDNTADSDGYVFSSDDDTHCTRNTTPHSTTSGSADDRTARALAKSDLAVENLVIELHYTDGYQRHRPDVKSYDLWCRENLERLIGEKGR